VNAYAFVPRAMNELGVGELQGSGGGRGERLDQPEDGSGTVTHNELGPQQLHRPELCDEVLGRARPRPGAGLQPDPPFGPELPRETPPRPTGLKRTGGEQHTALGQFP
jgi:hypothetical protein